MEIQHLRSGKAIMMHFLSEHYDVLMARSDLSNKTLTCAVCLSSSDRALVVHACFVISWEP